MKGKIHHLKTWREPFDAVLQGVKTAEFRINDRGFEVGHYLNLREWDEIVGQFTGRSRLVVVTHIVSGGLFGIPEGYCVMSIKLVPSPDNP